MQLFWTEAVSCYKFRDLIAYMQPRPKILEVKFLRRSLETTCGPLCIEVIVAAIFAMSYPAVNFRTRIRALLGFYYSS